MKPLTRKAFGDRVRVRVAGFIFSESQNHLLLVKHEGLWENKPFWTPPGGGVSFGESLTETLIREIREETGLVVTPGPLAYTLDFVRTPLHAVSFYFRCTVAGGRLRTGSDPEFNAENQLIRRVDYHPIESLGGLNLYPEIFRTLLRQESAFLSTSESRHLGTFR